jgi:uncharacterized protein (TIGR03067 family)
MVRYLILFVGLSPLVAAGDEPGAAPAKDEGAGELAKLQGKWQLAALDRDGQVTKIRRLRDGHLISIEKELWIEFTDEGKELVTKSSLRLEPKKKPGLLELTVVYNEVFPGAKGTRIEASYELKGDELKIAVPFLPWGPRPKVFATQKGDRFEVSAYKRIKKE